MDNFKYSLKTNQFNKKRHHIFEKQVQKQSISLQVHEPSHSVAHLLDFNKTQDLYGLASSSRESELYKQPTANSKQQNRLKFKKNSSRKISQTSKNSNHQIKATNKITITQPQNSHDKTMDKNLQAQITTQQLQALKYVLYNNQQRLKNLVDSMNSLYRNTIQLYSKHERKLRQLVNSRCYEIARIYRSVCSTIKSKEKYLQQLEYKIDLFVNTLKDSKQTLRLTKIKQQCIQALQKQHKIISQKQKQKLKYQLSQKKLNKQYFKFQQQKFSNIKTKPRQQSKNRQTRMINSAKQVTLNSHNKLPRKQLYILNTSLNSESILTESQVQPSVNLSQVSSFLNSNSNANLHVNSNSNPSPSPHISISSMFQSNKSPFEANQLLQISNSMPVQMNMNSQTRQNIEEQYSFRNSLQNDHNQYHPQNPKPHHKHTTTNINTTCSNFKKQTRQNHANHRQTPEKYQKLKLALLDLVKTYSDNQIWLDNLNCLRRRNGTYVLDFQGNPLMCCRGDYQRLVVERVVVRTGMQALWE